VLLAAVAVIGADCTVDALFVSPTVDGVIEDRIIEAIDGAEDELLVAMYSFTDDDIGFALVMAYLRGVEVYVLLDDGQDSDSQGREYPNLTSVGIPVGVEHQTGLLHHKFLVVDRELVITGSYNWSDSADQSNFENVVVISCAEIAEAYACEFVYIANDLLGMNWPITCDGGGNGNGGGSWACEECLSRLNRATRADFDAIPGIGAALSQILVDGQPFAVSYCTGRQSVLNAIDALYNFGPARSEDVVNWFCSDLFD